MSAKTKPARCLYCGQYFQPNDRWMQVCWPCWHGQKTGQVAPPWETIERQQAWIELLTRELDKARLERAAALQRVSEIQVNLPRLLQLCHPDRHEGSRTAAANEITAWLLALRHGL